MSEGSNTTYDEIPYSATPFYDTHPDRLATKAIIYGLAPPPVDHCRVLELGCGRGGNLIPMAQELPGSQFIGIDLSRGQIASAQAVLETLGLTNIKLLPMSITDVGEDFGQFDYIICHGVYSWVPPAVQEKILTICKQRLASNGVAYVSYNTYPGWHIRGIVREMLLYHTARFPEPRKRLHQARAFLDFLREAVEGSTNAYGRMLEEEIEELKTSADSYVFHELLEDTNQPISFTEFAERAAGKGLQYLSEAQLRPLPSNMSPNVLAIINQLGSNIIAQEQYSDFLRGRPFRRTLLCHDTVAVRRPPLAEPVLKMHVTTRLQPARASDPPLPDGREQFATAKGMTMTTNNPVLKAALHILFKNWPRSLAVEDLWDRVQARTARKDWQSDGAEPEQSARQLADSLLQCYLGDLVELHVQPAEFVLEISERPVASPMARLQAATGESVTNLRHYTAELADFDRVLLPFLDGSRDRAGIVEMLTEAVRNGDLTIQQDQGVFDKGATGAVLSEAVDQSLRRLAGSALLTS